MALDPAIPLGVKLYHYLDDEAKQQDILNSQQQRAQQQYLLQQRKADDQRGDDYRNALGDVLNGGSFDAEKRAITADPEGYLQFQGKQINLKADKLKTYQMLNDTAMQLVSAVHDDASLQAAKAQARQLYQANGEDSSFIDQIPDKYSPELVRDLQMKGMDTAHQLQAVARENQIELYAENMTADNQRADRSQANLQSYRQQRLAQQQHTQEMVNARTERGQDLSHADRQEATKARVLAARSRSSGRPATVAAGDGAIIKNPKTGQRMQLKNGQWVAIP